MRGPTVASLDGMAAPELSNQLVTLSGGMEIAAAWPVSRAASRWGRWTASSATPRRTSTRSAISPARRPRWAPRSSIFPECCDHRLLPRRQAARHGRGAGRADLEARSPTSRKKATVHLAVGMFTTQGNALCNSQLLFSPEGKCLAVYNKAHLFSKEREICRPGDKPVVVDTAARQDRHDDLLRPDLPGLCAPAGRHGRRLHHQQHELDQRPLPARRLGLAAASASGLVSTRALENVTVLAMANRIGREEVRRRRASPSTASATPASPATRARSTPR